MKSREVFVRGRRIAAIGMVLLLVVLTTCGCGTNGNLTLEKIVYDKSKKNSVVYIKENDEYVPYLVLTSDYGGNVLLFREDVLSEEMPYKPSVHGGGGGALSGGWTHYEYGAYYEESSIDEFLNTEFLEVFSPDVQAAIMDTTIEVTDKESYNEKNWANVTHMIERKVFLLSAVELGVEFGVGYIMTREGKPLKYFKDKELSVKTAYKADGTAWPYWTRTPELWETCLVTVIGTEAVGSAPADSLLGVRPAFCMGKDTIVQESDSILAGESVYIIE